MTAVLQEVGNNPKLLYRMTVRDYHRMIKTGGLQDGAPFELLDGHLVRKIRSSGTEDPMTVNPEPGSHDGRFAAGGVNPQLRKRGCELRDRYIEQINAAPGMLLPPSASGKYDVSRALPNNENTCVQPDEVRLLDAA